MRHGVVVINTSRGNLLPAEKLLRALLSGKATAAGLDVWHHESLPVGHPRVIAMTPAAFYSDESLLELQTIAASQGAAALQRSRQNNSVNPTVLEGQQLRARFLTCARTSAEQPSGEAVEESTI
jgi:phosphoglycerate dehydrogenase-like enzyme